MPVSRFVLLLLAAKAEAQRPSLRQPQALTTDDKIAASRARTSADPAARSVPAASAGLALLAHPNPISNPNPNPNPLTLTLTLTTGPAGTTLRAFNGTTQPTKMITSTAQSTGSAG